MLKREMIEHINKQYAEYLGHNDLVCCTSYTKNRYQEIINSMNLAIAWQKLAKRLQKQAIKEFGTVSWMFVYKNPRLDWFRDKAEFAYKKASDYWFKS